MPKLKLTRNFKWIEGNTPPNNDFYMVAIYHNIEPDNNPKYVLQAEFKNGKWLTNSGTYLDDEQYFIGYYADVPSPPGVATETKSKDTNPYHRIG